MTVHEKPTNTIIIFRLSTNNYGTRTMPMIRCDRHQHTHLRMPLITTDLNDLLNYYFKLTIY